VSALPSSRDLFVESGRVVLSVATLPDHNVMCGDDNLGERKDFLSTHMLSTAICAHEGTEACFLCISCQPVIWKMGVRRAWRRGVCSVGIRTPEYGGVALLSVTLSQCYRPRDWYIEGQVSWHFGSLPAESGGRWPLCVTRFFCDGP